MNEIVVLNLAFVVSYDGTAYCGFQSQEGLPTIQEKLTKAIEKITCHPLMLNGSGRTDGGVHANGQVINFHTTRQLSVERWPLAINSCLPGDIHVRRAILVPEMFHARIDSKQKTYRYEVNTCSVNNVLLRHMQYHFPRKLNVSEMMRAAQELVGTHDFRAFCVVKSLKENNVRTLFELSIEEIDSGLRFQVTGNGFLHNMVRIIVGTLLTVGEGRLSVEQVIQMIITGERPQWIPTAPAHGLQLWAVMYDQFSSE